MHHRCHFCGKTLNEIPYKCRRCGYSFCSDHHLPENHRCPGHHHHDSRHHRKYCGNCGRELPGLPYRCHRCGLLLCDNCRLPENHGCRVTPDPVSPSIQFIDKKTMRNTWANFKDSVTLKNFTIVSLALILISFLPTYYPLDNFREIFSSMYTLGLGASLSHISFML